MDHRLIHLIENKENSKCAFKTTYQAVLRNKLLAEAFYLKGEVEKYGTGYIRIRKLLLEYPELKLTFEALGGFIRNTIRTGYPISEKSSEKILALVSEKPEITIEDLAKHLNISTRAIEKQLAILKTKKLIKRIEPDHGGYWEVK